MLWWKERLERRRSWAHGHFIQLSYSSQIRVWNKRLLLKLESLHLLIHYINGLESLLYELQPKWLLEISGGRVIISRYNMCSKNRLFLFFLWSQAFAKQGSSLFAVDDTIVLFFNLAFNNVDVVRFKTIGITLIWSIFASNFFIIHRIYSWALLLGSSLLRELPLRRYLLIGVG